MDFFQWGPLPANQIEGYFDLKLVLLSFLVAMFASYVALNIAGSLRKVSRERLSFWLWFASGALVMGTGIWTMHFIGMEAFIMHMPMEYDPFLTLLSLVIAIFASGFALYGVSRAQVTLPEIMWGGILMGAGIASMHYVGMSAMLHVHIHYIPSIFFGSILIAVVASQVALWLMIKGHEHAWVVRLNLVSAIIMGIAICGMHYVGMFAAVFTEISGDIPSASTTHSGLPPFYIGLSSSIIMLIFLALSTNNERFLMTLQESNAKLLANEKELKEARVRAEQASLAKSYFLANMSHEIRTPLNVILGTASLLERSDLDQKERKYVERITLSSRILLNLIMDILDFSKIEAGELKLNEVGADFIKLVKEVLTIASTQAEEKKIKLIIKGDLDKPLKIISDPIRLQQVITNLVGNAVKFTAKGEVAVTIQSKRLDENHVNIRLEVKDQGIGIKEEDYGKIFKKFSQVDDSSTRKFGGTGLGLVISKKLVEILGGNIGFESQLGIGSTFWFDIPFKIDRSL
jgi:two-component system sensor histidine kinase/response regulator